MVYDEIINVTDSVSTNVTNSIPTNMTRIISVILMSTVSINSADKNVRSKIDCYIFHTLLLVIILLSIIDIICYHYTKQIKSKTYRHTNNIKMKNNELK